MASRRINRGTAQRAAQSGKPAAFHAAHDVQCPKVRLYDAGGFLDRRHGRALLAWRTAPRDVVSACTEYMTKMLGRPVITIRVGGCFGDGDYVIVLLNGRADNILQINSTQEGPFTWRWRLQEGKDVLAHCQAKRNKVSTK
jgi:hypothetical protein